MCLALCEDFFRKGNNSSNMAWASLGLVLDQCKRKSHGILRIPYSLYSKSIFLYKDYYGTKFFYGSNFLSKLQ